MIEKSGLSFVDALGLVFITLKLLEKIDWPWIWVLCPIWLEIIQIIIVILVHYYDD